jgi:multidrug efflux pump subunit AcrA (membrane-fusion protein)
MSEDRHASLGITPVEPDEGETLVKRGQVMRRTKLIAAVVVVLLAIGAGRTVVGRMANNRALETGVAEQARQYVRVATPKALDAGPTLSLPGTLQGYVQAPIAARQSGYLRRWYKDIGSTVRKGELLAEIEAPELDQQLSQAVAARAQTRRASSLRAARSTAGKRCARRTRCRSRSSRRSAVRTRRRARTSRQRMPTSSACASSRASSASPRRSLASSRAATSTSAT